MTTTPEQLVQVFPLPDCPGFGDTFGAPRFVGGPHRHAGNDLPAPNGVDVLSPTDGTYEIVDNSVGGISFKVHHPGGGYVYGAHLKRHLVEDGAKVTAGQRVGIGDQTGDAALSVPHLHFEIHPFPTPPLSSLTASPFDQTKVVDQGDPKAVDPFPFLKEAQEMPQFTDDEEAALKTLIPLAGSIAQLAGLEAQTSGHTQGLIARFQEKQAISLPPPATFDGDATGPYFRQGWAAMDAAIVAGAVEL
jgi:hypothetical protein